MGFIIVIIDDVQIKSKYILDPTITLRRDPLMVPRCYTVSGPRKIEQQSRWNPTTA